MKKRLLLVDDNLLLLEAMQKKLRSLGYNVTTATNGLEGIEIATSRLPDVIVMDMKMPVMDGFQLATKIRKNPKTQAIPILAATAMAGSGHKEKCLASGCDSYIAKPFTLYELGAAIEELLKKQSA